MSPNNVNSRASKHRAGLRTAGLRPIQIWVPDARQPNFAEECRRQSILTTAADAGDGATHSLIEQATLDLDGWET